VQWSFRPQPGWRQSWRRGLSRIVVLHTRLGENHLNPKPTAVEKIVDKPRMNCAELSISSTEKFKLARFYCLSAAQSLPIFHRHARARGNEKQLQSLP
jgi:hypothetical protein